MGMNWKPTWYRHLVEFAANQSSDHWTQRAIEAIDANEPLEVSPQEWREMLNQFSPKMPTYVAQGFDLMNSFDEWPVVVRII